MINTGLISKIDRLGQKLNISLYLKKLWTSYDKTRWMNWISDKNKRIGFWFGFSPSVGYKTWTVPPGRGMRSVCLFVCLSVCLSPTGHNFKPILKKLHHTVEFVMRKKPIVLRSKGQQRPKVNNIGEVSKILKFHPIDLKFEEDLYFRSMKSTSQLFLRSTSTERSI